MSGEKHLVVTRKVGDHEFGQRTSDGYFNATAMCRAAGKRFHDYAKSAKTKAVLEALEAETRKSVSELAQRVRGGQPDLQGTWVHPYVAIDLASWLSPEFKALVPIWVTDWFRRQGEMRATLKEWISPDLRPWILTFPPEFYGEIYRLNGWDGPVGPKRPSVIGHYTNDIVYARLEPGLLATLRDLNPRRLDGDRKDRHHQWLTAHQGYPALKERLAALVALMQASDTWKEFQVTLDRVFPIHTDQLSLFESRKRHPTLWD